MIFNILAVGAGGFVGASLRYLIVFLYAVLSLIVGCAVIFGVEVLVTK